MKTCSNCKNTIKLKRKYSVYYLCDVDSRSCGKICLDWKPIGYSRKDFKRQTQIEIRMEEQE